MLISVIIPVYNGEKYLERVYESVKKQTYKNLEIIFFNDASKDNSLNILKKLTKDSKKVKVFSSKNNNGPSGAKNEGLKHATGEYVIFIDCDDYVSPDYITNVVKEIKNSKKADIVITGFTKVDEDGKVLYRKKYKNNIVAVNQSIMLWSKAFKRSFLEQYQIQLPYGAILDDVVFHAYLMQAHPTSAYVEEYGYYYVYNQQSQSHTILKSFKEGSLQIAMDYFKEIQNNPVIAHKDSLCYYAYKYMCWHLLKSGSKVGTVAMQKEYTMAFDFLEENFPEYRKFKNVRCRYEKRIVKFALYTIFWLRKMHLDWLFFKIYSNVNLQRFWPNL